MKPLYERLEVARLIATEMAGTIPEQDREKLRLWLESSPLHAREMEEIRAALRNGKSPFIPDADVAAEWRAFERMVRPGRKRFVTLARYAAAILIPLLAGVYVWTRIDSRPDTGLAEEKKKVSLLLDDGNVVWLDQSDDRLISEDGGVMIAMEQSTLVYNGPDSPGDNPAGYNTLSVPNWCDFSLQMSDGTRVWLNAGSRLSYPAVFTGSERRVKVEGEGYFEVSADKERPFVVDVAGVEVKVLGTSFNISSFSDKVETTLLEGSLLLTCGGEQVTLTPDRQAVWNGGGFTVKPVEARNYALWKEGIFWFEDDVLGDIMDNIGRWYDVDVVYRDPALRDLHFTVEMKRYENVDEALQKIGQTKQVSFTVKGRIVEVF